MHLRLGCQLFCAEGDIWKASQVINPTIVLAHPKAWRDLQEQVSQARMPLLFYRLDSAKPTTSALPTRRCRPSMSA
jgi:hypothetical protein